MGTAQDRDDRRAERDISLTLPFSGVSSVCANVARRIVR
jgi:hypothetical protein